jgi:hypothetical protein
MLTSKGPWTLATTTSDPLDPLERWDHSPATFNSIGSKLIVRIEYRYMGIQTPEVSITERGFRFESGHQGNVDMAFDPGDEDHPFKGKKSTATYWLTRRK